MRLTTSIRRALVASALAIVLTACGAKTGLRTWDASPLPPECNVDSDCDDGRFCNGAETCHEGRCVPGAPLVCMDNDRCTNDSCSEETHACVFMHVTQDQDGDGYYAPRAGTLPGAPGACGDDCNDMNAMIHPGATEICNGIDDNCNGIVDDGAMFTPSGPDVSVSDADTAPASTGGLAYSGSQYMASYFGYIMGTAHVFFSALDRLGNRLTRPPQIQETLTPSDAYGAVVAWSGTVLGIAWEDRRDGDYEIYFNRLDPNGEKLGPDERITFARGFSINPSIVWTGSEFLIAWQDERDTLGTGGYEIYTQRVDEQGRQIEDNHRLTHNPANSEAPVIAYNGVNVAIAWVDGRDGPMDEPAMFRALYFAEWTPTFTRVTSDTRATPANFNVESPAIAWSRDRWIVAWHDGDLDSPDHEIWAVARDGMGNELVGPTRISNDPNWSRYPALLPLGDRNFVVWADDRDHNDGYEIYARMIDPNLAGLTPETRVTFAARDSVYPAVAFGPEGDMGILFSDQRDGPWRMRFTRLQCAIPH